ncbi:hypothetical protein [Corynebacterium lowii]|nr:hypothetical protein [Corynebacterium lowii]MDP9852560.1 hypothetical protein [Corynebacterium lowii]
MFRSVVPLPAVSTDVTVAKVAAPRFSSSVRCAVADATEASA